MDWLNKNDEFIGELYTEELSNDIFEETVETIKYSGVEILTEPVTLPNGVSTMFFRDIDGNILHLISRKNPLV